MNNIKILLLVFFVSSCATVVNNSNFDVPSNFEAPKRKKSISITVFVRLYDEDGVFYGYGYDKNMTQIFLDTFRQANAFTKVSALTSTCSTSYVCLDIPTSKKVRAQRHLNIIIPELYPKKKFSPLIKGISAITLGLVPAYYNLEANWEVNLFNKRRELLYDDDTTYEGKTLSATWLHLRKDKLSESSDEHHEVFYKKVVKKVLWNVLFQLRRFP